MNRVIILEGPDGGGKTTVAETLRQMHGFKIVHCRVPPEHATPQGQFDRYVRLLDEALADDQPVVFDRHYLGETIYGPVMRGRSLLDTAHVRLLERVIRARDVKLVFVLPNFETCLTNWRVKHQDYVPNADMLRVIYERFKQEADRWGTGGLHRYDYTEDGTVCHLDHVFRPAHTLPPHMLGSPSARLLLVGERVNTNKTTVDRPFFEVGGCSGYLDEALQAAGIPEEDVALMNALDPHGRPNPPSLERFSTKPAVVTLGKVAAQVTGVGADVALPHPQWHKRFCAQEGVQGYAQLLREVYDGALATR